jgi:integrase
MSVVFVRVKGDANHHLYRRGNVYWIRFRKSGRPALQESLDTENLTDARIARDKFIAKYLGMRPRFAGAKLVGETFEEWIDLKSGKASATVASIKNQWEKHLKEYFAGLLLDEVTESEWLRYVNQKRSVEKYKDRKFFNDRKYLSMFLHWCHREGLIDKLPRLPDVDPEIHAGKIFTDEEIDKLLSKANADLKLQILMALTMGMRVGEILSLEWTQINFKTGILHLPAEKTKIRKARSFKASQLALDQLKMRQANSKSPWVFPSPHDPGQSVGKGGNKTAWKNIKDSVKVSGRFHDLRHTFLTRAFKTATNPALICHFAGLSLEEAERTYLHFSVDDTAAISDLIKVGDAV